MHAYFESIRALLTAVEKLNASAMETAAEAVANCLQNNGMLHTFGTGHGHMLAEEIFYRAGGLAPVNAILDPALMLHVAALSSSNLERLSGYAEVVLSRYQINAGDVIIIASNSGRNGVPVEMAIAAKARGMTVIALTSMKHTQSQPSRHPSGKRLFELADIILDNGGEIGDAAFAVEGVYGKMGATSTIVGAALLHALEIATVQKLVARGIEPPVVISANVDGSDAHNARMFAQFRHRVRHL